MNNVTVDGWKWASHDEDDYGSDITTINFNIYKKGLFGKLKKVKGDYASMFNVGVVRPNPRNFRHPKSSPVMIASRSIIFPSLWKI